MNKTSLLLSLIFVLTITPGRASGPIPKSLAQPTPHQAYAPGERLVYDVRYLGIRAGTAIMEVMENTKINGRDAYHILSTVRSNDFVSFFYPVDNRVETFIDSEKLYSHLIKIKQHQGKRRREKVIGFNQIHHKAVQVKNNQSTVYEIPPNVQDSLSSLYFFRTLPTLDVGTSAFIPVHESRKNWQLEIQALKKERLKTEVGEFDTIKVKAFVRYEGLLMDKGDVYIWFTDDERRIPVRITSKIKIGSISIFLRSLSGKNDVLASDRIERAS